MEAKAKASRAVEAATKELESAKTEEHNTLLQMEAWNWGIEPKTSWTKHRRPRP
jgi:hypothetical protein